MRNEIVLSVIASLTLLGCSKQLDENDAQVAFAATSATLTMGAASAQTSSNSAAVQTGDTVAFRDSAATSVDYDFACAGGGTAHFAGSFTGTDDVAGNADVAFSFKTSFSACKAVGFDITIDGDLDYASAISTSDSGTSITLSMTGELSYEGQVDGACDIDVKVAVNTGAMSASSSYSGSVCGHDASATLNVQG